MFKMGSSLQSSFTHGKLFAKGNSESHKLIDSIGMGTRQDANRFVECLISWLNSKDKVHTELDGIPHALEGLSSSGARPNLVIQAFRKSYLSGGISRILPGLESDVKSKLEGIFGLEPLLASLHRLVTVEQASEDERIKYGMKIYQGARMALAHGNSRNYSCVAYDGFDKESYTIKRYFSDCASDVIEELNLSRNLVNELTDPDIPCKTPVMILAEYLAGKMSPSEKRDFLVMWRRRDGLSEVWTAMYPDLEFGLFPCHLDSYFSSQANGDGSS